MNDSVLTLDARDNLVALLDRLDALHDMAREYHDRDAVVAWTRASDEVRRERDRLRRAFADARGWESNPRSTFTLHKLATGRRPRTSHDPLSDHGHAETPVCDVLDRFRVVRIGPNNKVGHWPIGVVVHTKADPTAVEAFAERAGLACTPLPWSWLDPRHYRSVLLEHPDPDNRAAGGPNPRASGAPHQRSATRSSRGGAGVASETPDARSNVRRPTSPSLRAPRATRA